MKKRLRRTAIILLQIIFAICVIALAACSGSCSSCSSCSSCNKDINPDMPENVTTTRLPVPTDGSKPTEHKSADNIAYLAYVLDNQPYYHAYAHNSTKSSFYEQITQTWKEYKNAELSGKNAGIMICSDISYSTLVKSASQSCFVNSNNGEGDAVYMRNGSKPSKDSTSTTVEWSNDKPTYYSKEDYLKTYGEFSTELTVYAINSDTIERVGEVVDKGDGTYSINALLKPDAACWYQYGMKTRGGLKAYPEFQKIDITFTFDAQWRILSTYCEEKASISPSALGGMSMESTSKTTTTFDYTQGGFDNAHYAYFPAYFDEYVGQIIVNEPTKNDPELLDVLASAFSQVLTAEGQQFDLSLTLGETDYDGKIYLKVENMDVSNLEVRFALGKKDSGNQDLYIEYKDGAINAYYSDGFAATASIDKVAGSVTRLSDWIKNTFSGEEDNEPETQAEEGSGISLDSLLALAQEGFGFNEEAAWIVIKSDNLLDLGIGVDVRLDCTREITEEGNNFDFVKLQLATISYGGDKINVSGEIIPDKDGEIIARNPSQTPADIADYIDGVVNLVKGGSYSVSINFDGTATDIEYIKNVTLETTALLNLSEDFKTLSVSAPVTVNYSGLTVKLTAYYTIGFEDGGYGDIYLHLTEIGGKTVDAKVYSNINDAKTAVEQLINYFKGTPAVQTLSEEDGEEQVSNNIASIVNKVLSLDFGAIIKQIKGNSEKIELGIGVDEVLGALDVDLGIEMGTVTLSLALSEGTVSLEGKLPSLGLTLGVAGSEQTVALPDSADYLNVAQYLNGAYKLLNSPSYEVNLTFINSGLTIGTSALVKLENNYNDITVYAPVDVSYGSLKLSLGVYYTINLADKDYGTVYLSVNSINEKAVDLKVYCDIQNTVDAVNEIIKIFKDTDGDNGAAVQAESNVIANVIEKVVSINYAELIKQLKADNTGIDIAIDADYLLGEIGLSLGKDLTLGTLSFKLTLDEEENLALVAKLPDMGVELSVYGTESAVPTPDLSAYADAEQYIRGVGKLINGKKYSVNVSLDGTADIEYIKGATLQTTALLNLSEDFKTLSVCAPVTVTYSGLTVKLTAYYTIGFEKGGYGDVYLHLTEIGGKTVDAKVYANINDAKNAVEQLIAYFKDVTKAKTLSEEGQAAVANIVDKVLSLDFGAIIKELKSSPDKIELGLSLDEVLSALKVDLGIEFGTVNLTLSQNGGAVSFGGSIPSLGLTLGVEGSDTTVTIPDSADYLDVTQFVKAVNSFVEGASYSVSIKLDGTTDIEYLKDATLETTALLNLSEDFKTLSVSVPLTVNYSGLTVELDAYYTINFANGGYGDVYLHITKIGGKTVDAKVCSNIKEAKAAVEQLIAFFSPSKTRTSSEEKTANIVDTILSLDFGAIIKELKSSPDKIELGVGVDEVLTAFGVTLGSIEIGKVNVSATLKNGNISLGATIPSLGVTLGVAGSGDTVENIDTDAYLNVADYINAAYALINGRAFNVGIELDGKKTDVEYLNNVYLKTTALLNLSEDLKTLSVSVPLTVTYSDLTVKLNAYYAIGFKDGNYGNIYLHIYEIGGATADIKVFCNIENTVDAVNEVIKLFKTSNGTNGTTDTPAESDKKTNTVAKIIAKVVSINYKELINELTADSTGLNLSVNGDKLLGETGVSLGKDFTLGTLTLSLAMDKDNSVKLTANLPKYGAALTFEGTTGEVVLTNADTYLDAEKYVKGVHELIESTLYEVDLTLGNAELGLNVSTTAYLKLENNFNDITVYAPVTVVYDSYTVNLTAYYTIKLATKNYGEVYLSIEKINDNTVGAKVYCDIQDTVKTVNEIIAMFKTNDNGNGGNTDKGTTVKVADIIAKVVAIDYAEIINEIKAGNSGINVSVDADKLLGELAASVGSKVKLGTLTLNITHDGKRVALWAGLSDIGVSIPKPSVNLSGFELILGVKGNDGKDENGDIITIPVPDKAQYLNVDELAILVKQAAEEAQAIINAKDIIFSLDTALTVDGVKMTLDGEGEIVWKDNKIRVAVSADLEIAEGDNKQTLSLKLVYDENNKDSQDSPLVTFTVDNYGMKIYSRDLTDTDNGFKEIITKVKEIAGKFITTQESSATPAMQSEEGGQESSGEQTSLEKLLDIIFTQISNVTVSLVETTQDEKTFNSLVISYLNNGTLILNANGGLNLDLGIENNNSTEILSLTANVHAPAKDESKLNELNTEFEKSGYTFYTAENKDTFVKAVYEYVKDVLEHLTIGNLLGADTYEVTLDLYGENSGIKELENIRVHATVKYTDSAVFKVSDSTVATVADDTTVTGTKLVEISAQLNINGTDVNVSAIYFKNSIFVTVYNVGGTNLYASDGVAGIKITASTDNIYKVVESVISIIKNENFNAIIDALSSGTNGTSAQSEDGAGNGVIPDKKTEIALTDILNALFTLEIKFGKSEDGTLNTLTVNIDNALKAFGLGFEIGTVKVAVNPQTHAITATVSKVKTVTDEITGEPAETTVNWIELSANTVENATTLEFDTTGYINIGFVADLVDDVNTTLDNMTTTETVEGEKVTTTDLRVSLTGNLRVDIKYSVISTNVTINDVVLTVGLDEDDEFYFTLKGNLQETTFAMFTVAKAMPISVTYSNGYITMGRTNNNGSKIYKVMTLAYLIDNLLDKENSPIRWLLGTDSTPWNLICDNVKLPISSGLSDKQYVYLYDNGTSNPDDTPKDDTKFTLSSILRGLNVKIGNYTSTFGTNEDIQAAVSQFNGLTDNYYAFNLDLSSLIGNTLSSLYAAIVRNDNGGLKGVDVFADLDGGYLSVNARLDNGLITKETADKEHAENFYKTVTASQRINLDYYKDNANRLFGCYSSENGAYDYSEFNIKYSLKVYSFESTDYSDYRVNEKGTVLTHDNSYGYGSTVYTFAEEQWLNEAHTRKLIYVDEAGNDLGLSFTLKADATIYMMIVGDGEVEFKNVDNSACAVVDGEGADGNVIMSLITGAPLPAPISLTKDNEAYTFAGWYKESECTEYVTSVQAGISTYYAKYIPTYTSKSNGVTYKFIYNAEDGLGGHYIVYGFNSADVTDKINDTVVDYTDDNSTIVLENTIDGYEVKAIKAEAFAKKNIKNVVVPENITEVGEKAFLDNYGMLSAVFLAKEVTMSGSVNGKNYPFYGCSESSGGKTTKLDIYYNSVVPETQWNLFRDNDKFISVGGVGGSLNRTGTWGYAKYSVTEGYFMSDYGYKDGLVTTDINDGYLRDIKDAVLSELNKATADSGVIYKYSVTVSDTLVESMHCITVSITDNSANAWNKLVLDGNDIQLETSKFIEKVNDTYFVRPNATVTVKPVSGNNGLTRLTVYENAAKSKILFDSGDNQVTASMSFTMPENLSAFVTANCAVLPITEITLKSVVAVDGFTDDDGDLVYKKVLTISEGEALTYQITATGYSFLGWAFENSANYLEFENTVKHRAYYAVWAVDRGEVSSVSLTNGEFTAEIVSDEDGSRKAASVYGWYAYEISNNEVEFKTAVTPSTLTALTTKIYPRMVFTLSYEMSSSLSGTNYYFVSTEITNTDSKATQKNGTLKDSIKILENTDFKYRWTLKDSGESDIGNVLQILYSDANGTEQTLYFRIKNKGPNIWDGSGTKSFNLSGAISNGDVPGEANVYGSQPVKGNMSVEFKVQ